MTTLEQKLEHAKKILAKLDEQRALLKHYEKHPNAKIQAAEMRQSVRISMHHLEDAILQIQKVKGEMA